MNLDSFPAHGEEQSANVTDAKSNTRPAFIALVIGIILFIIGLPLFIGGQAPTGEVNLGMYIPGAIAFPVDCFGRGRYVCPHLFVGYIVC